jgi:hypothetical protein
MKFIWTTREPKKGHIQISLLCMGWDELDYFLIGAFIGARIIKSPLEHYLQIKFNIQLGWYTFHIGLDIPYKLNAKNL